VEESNKRQLEGLLQARSEDLRHGRYPRRRRPATTLAFEQPDVAAEGPVRSASARSCEACGGEVGARRLRAMPRATLCLECQRSAERARP
jgi:DksA/TraR C4-type zinc finger protein